MRAAVVTLGDLGRSARMQYHARALAANGVDVDLVGYEGTALPRAIADERRIRVHRIVPSTLRLHKGVSGFAYVLAAIPDACRLSFRLWQTLRALTRPDLVLIQNPPQFPTLAVTWFSLRRRGVRFVIDWHNLGYTVLRLRLGGWHPAVRLGRWLERRDARRVDGNLCVSRALAAFLESRFGVHNACVLYDRPASVFVPLPRAEREQFRQALFARLGIRGTVVGFIVCPTSWTEDEDFDVAIEAVLRLEERIRGWEASEASRRFPGSGHSRDRRRHEARRVRAAVCRAAGAADPAALAVARARGLSPRGRQRGFGLCLHRSSSGLDIPMKVADLFGAGVPVLALDYGACLAERVRHGDNGLLFSTSRQLADVLFDLFETFPADQTSLERLRTGARKSARPTWEEGWAREARPVLLPWSRRFAPERSCSAVRGEASLALSTRECEQHVAGRVSGKQVSGVHIHRPIDDDGARPVERSALGLDAVDRVVLPQRVGVPDDPAVLGVVRPQVAVESAGKDDPRDDRGGCRLGWAASGRVSTARMRRVPRDLPGFQIQGIQPSARLGIQHQRYAEQRRPPAFTARRRSRDLHIRNRRIDVVAVGGDAPLNAAHAPALADLALPEDLALPVGVDRVHDARFLAGNQGAAAVAQRDEHRLTIRSRGPVRSRWDSSPSPDPGNRSRR